SGYGVSTCATCDGFFCKDQDVLVVGGGDTAIEDAIYLTEHARRVTVVHRRGELRATQALVDAANASPKIEWAWHTRVARIMGERGVGGVQGAMLVDTRTGEERPVACQAVFVAIGRRPATQLVEGQLALDPEGYIARKDASTATSVAGVFAA